MKFKTIKRIIYFFIFCLMIAALVMDFYRPVISSMFQKNLSKVFVGSSVSIGDCQISQFRKLSFYNVIVQKDKVYDVRVEEIDIYFNFSSIFTQTVPKVVLKDLDVAADLLGKNILEYGRFLKQGSREKTLVKKLILKDMNFYLKSNEISIDARLSADLDLIDQSVSFLNLDVASMESNGIIIKDALLRLNSHQDRGKLTIGSIKYNKAEIKELNGIVHGGDGNIFLEFLSVKTFGGRLKGSVSLKLDSNPHYFAEVKVKNMKIEKIISDFELDEKIQMDGRLSGELIVEGNGTDMEILSGNFSTTKSGGKLIITDTQLLKNIARSGNQSVDILVDSLKDYHYNTGTIALSLVEEGLNLEIALNGPTGKRNLSVMLHNLNEHTTYRTK